MSLTCSSGRGCRAGRRPRRARRRASRRPCATVSLYQRARPRAGRDRQLAGGAGRPGHPQPRRTDRAAPAGRQRQRGGGPRRRRHLLRPRRARAPGARRGRVAVAKLQQRPVRAHRPDRRRRAVPDRRGADHATWATTRWCSAGRWRPPTDILSSLWLVLIVFGGAGGRASRPSPGPRWPAPASRPVRELSAAVEHVAATDDLTPDRGDRQRTTWPGWPRRSTGCSRSLASSRERQQQLIADAGHELRTPLTSLRTNIELLAARRPDRHAARRRTGPRSCATSQAQLAEFTTPDRRPGPAGPRRQRGAGARADRLPRRGQRRAGPGPAARPGADLRRRAEPAATSSASPTPWSGR